MSDAPARTIAGLKPRTATPDLSRLQRRNRTEATVADTPPAEPTEPEKQPQPATAPKKRATRQPKTQAPQTAITLAHATTKEAERTGRLSTYLTTDTLQRARATYRATSHLEHDRTFSEFVERAIHAEIIRREKMHNEGERYNEDTSQLRPGRPLG